MSFKKPTPELVTRALNQLKTYHDRRYFFAKLDNPYWAEPLYMNGCFSNPPEVIKEDNSFRLQDWPELDYLSRMAAHVPELALQIISEIETENDLVKSTAIKVARGLPPEMGMKFFKKKLTWFGSPASFFTIEYEIENWCVALLKEGHFKQALEIADKTFLNSLPIGEDAQLKTWSRDDWHFKSAIEKVTPYFINGYAKEYLAILVLKLAYLLKNSTKSDVKSPRSSCYWHRAIEDHDQNDYQNEPENVLVETIRDVALAVISAEKQDGLTYVLEIFSKYIAFDIFTRLHIHICTVTGLGIESLIDTLMQNPKYFWSVGLHHELYHFMRLRFKDLGKDKQQTLLELINAGQSESEQPYFSYQILRKLISIASYLEGKDLERYNQLESECGEIEHPDFHIYSGTTWVGPTSPITDEELATKTPEEILAYLKEWKPAGTGWREATPRGLGRALEAHLNKEPEKFLGLLSQFIGLEPTYISSTLNTFRAIDKSKWNEGFYNEAFQLCEWIISQPVTIEGRQVKDSFDEDTNWQWSRQQIASFLHSRMRSFPKSYRERVWGILSNLFMDNDPSPEEEKRSIEGNSDPFTIAINSTRGEALQAIIEYGLWIRDSDNKADISEVFEALDWFIENDKLLSTRAVLGHLYPWIHLLSNEWAFKHKPHIFNTADKELFYAAWVAYITYCEPYNELLKGLEDLYLFALRDIPNFEGKKNSHYHGRLSQHVSLFFIRGLIPLESELLNLLFTNEISHEAFDGLGRALAGPEPWIEKLLINSQALWEYLRNTYGDIPVANLSADKKGAFASFGWWFTSKHLPQDWLFDNLAFCLSKGIKLERGQLVERLAELVNQHPIFVLQSLNQILANSSLEYFPSLAEEEVKHILEATKASGVPQIVNERHKLIDGFIKIGNFEFRSYLER